MFADRTDAGIRLAHILAEHKGQRVVVYALPRGGVAVAVPVARALEAPLDLILVRKIGHPDSPEYAVGAVTEDGDVVLNPAEADVLDRTWIDTSATRELQETHRQRALFLQDRPRVPATGKNCNSGRRRPRHGTDDGGCDCPGEKTESSPGHPRCADSRCGNCRAASAPWSMKSFPCRHPWSFELSVRSTATSMR